jgi:hypothetical protein
MPHTVTQPEPDVTLWRDGSGLVLLRRITQAAKDWVADHVEDYQSWAGCVVVEPRYVDDLVCGLESDGLTVAWSQEP